MEIVDPPKTCILVLTNVIQTLKNDPCDQSSPKQGIENLYPTKYQFVHKKLDVFLPYC
jgi:hypothetical protein